MIGRNNDPFSGLRNLKKSGGDNRDSLSVAVDGRRGKLYSDSGYECENASVSDRDELESDIREILYEARVSVDADPGDLADEVLEETDRVPGDDGVDFANGEDLKRVLERYG